MEKAAYHEPGDQGGQSRCSVPIPAHADANAHGKKNGDLVYDYAPCTDQELAGHGNRPCHGPSLHGGRTEQVADSHQKAAERHAGHRQHKRFSKFL